MSEAQQKFKSEEEEGVIEYWTEGAPHLLNCTYDPGYSKAVEGTIHEVQSRMPGLYSFRLIETSQEMAESAEDCLEWTLQRYHAACAEVREQLIFSKEQTNTFPQDDYD